MQLSERFRRGVVVPLDETAAAALAANDVDDVDDVGDVDDVDDVDDADDATRVHFVEVSSQFDFELLWETGIFASINEHAGSLLDDYEEEAVPCEVVPRVREVAQQYAKEHAGGDTGARFSTALVAACDVAQRCGMPVYFVL